MGIATSRYEDRVASSLGMAGHAVPDFEHNEALCGAGVLFLLPSLIQQGLLRTKEVYQMPPSHYYGLESVVLVLAIMALARIKNPEQLKQCKPGEIGRIIGLDRIPEVRSLRDKIRLLSEQQQAQKLNHMLIDQWYAGDHQDDAAFLYVDGHQRIYYGDKANLPAKYISRQKLCLSATTEFWVNDAEGLPVMVVIGQLTEKLQTVIEQNIIPRMMQTNILSPIDADNPPEQPQCTLVFDREAYEPAFFHRLWVVYRIAIITYRKNVKDQWPNNNFKPTDVQTIGQHLNMLLCDKETELGGHMFREVRRLSENGHQTAIITTHPNLQLDQIAGRMFSRWSQENFFKYLIADYDFDKMIEFGVETIDSEKQVVNPEYRRRSHLIKKHRERIRRLEAKFYPILEQAMDASVDQLPELTHRQAHYKEDLDKLKEMERDMIEERQRYPARIRLKDMPKTIRYNKLKTESKMLMNVIKMICYRAESAMTSLVMPHLRRAADEKRMFIKQIIQANADLIPNQENCTLTVVLHSLSAPRFNKAVIQLCQILTETQTIFPGTDLRMIFKTAAFSDCET